MVVDLVKVEQDVTGGNANPQDDTVQKQRTMKLSIAEGSCAVTSTTLIDNYLIPFALAIDASPFQVGIMSSTAGLISPLGQVIGSSLLNKASRKLVALASAFLHTGAWFLVVMLGTLAFFGFPRDALTWSLLLIFVVYSVIGGVNGDAWFSLMGDIVPQDQRGRYFARRNLIMTAAGMGTAFFFSFVMDAFKNAGAVFTGFLLVFFVGFLMRFASSVLYTRHYFPPFLVHTENKTSFHSFSKTITSSNFGKFTVLVTLITFGQWIAGPFFSVYMLKVLNFNYTNREKRDEDRFIKMNVV